MKSLLAKSILLVLVLASFGLKASMPPLPTQTTMKLENIPESYQDDYMMKYEFHGDGGYPYTCYAYGPFNSYEYNASIYMYYGGIYVDVYTKATSSSQWSYIGTAQQEDFDDIFATEFGGIYLFHYDFTNFYNP